MRGREETRKWQVKAKREGMGTYRVEYTITLTVEDGRELSFPKERFLTEDEISDVKEIPAFLEREFRDTEQTNFLLTMKSQLGKEITGTSLVVNKISELLSAGDDDQM